MKLINKLQNLLEAKGNLVASTTSLDSMIKLAKAKLVFNMKLDQIEDNTWKLSNSSGELPHLIVKKVKNRFRLEKTGIKPRKPVKKLEVGHGVVSKIDKGSIYVNGGEYVSYDDSIKDKKIKVGSKVKFDVFNKNFGSITNVLLI